MFTAINWPKSYSVPMRWKAKPEYETLYTSEYEYYKSLKGLFLKIWDWSMLLGAVSKVVGSQSHISKLSVSPAILLFMWKPSDPVNTKNITQYTKHRHPVHQTASPWNTKHRHPVMTHGTPNSVTGTPNSVTLSISCQISQLHQKWLLDDSFVNQKHTIPRVSVSE